MIFEGKISLEPTAAAVARFNSWLDQKFAESGIAHGVAADLRLCLNEVLANLFSYGFDKVPAPLALVDVYLERERARATVVDNGMYFDLRDYETPAKRDLMTGRLGGFGIPLIKERARQISYARDGEFNRLEIVCGPATP